MPKRPCLDCGVLTAGSRCPHHRRQVEYRQLQRKRAKRPHTYAEDKRRAQVVAAWRAEYGDWCPGWQRPPHPSSDLTAEHVVAFAAGGDECGELTVLCRPCNSRKSDSIG